MRWRGRRQSGNVEDRRRGGMMASRGGRAGFGGIGLIIVVVIGSLIFGVNPVTVLNMLQGGPVQIQQQSTAPPADDEMSQFVRTVLADTEDVWERIFAQGGADYREPTLVLFTGSTASACGFAQSATGPFYCPADEKVYIDLGFYDQLRRRFQAPGDFAQAYVIAHEVGHHVQNLIGVLPEFNRIRRQLSQTEANAMSVRVELQADCFAGIWANEAARRGYLERGDIEEALNAAAQIGDDAIQKRTQGYVVPDAFNHGTSEQRVRWFTTGFEDGDMAACDTFSTNRL